MPSLLPEDPTNIAGFLSSCLNWTLKKAVEKENEKVYSNVAVFRVATTAGANYDSIARLDTSELIALLNGGDGAADRCRCVVLGIVYLCLVYRCVSVSASDPVVQYTNQLLSDNDGTVAAAVGVSPVPHEIHVFLPVNFTFSPGTSFHSVEFLHFIVSILKRDSLIALDILSVASLLAVRFNQLDVFSRTQFTGGIIPWIFYRLCQGNDDSRVVQNNKQGQGVTDGETSISATPSLGIAWMHLLLQLPTTSFVEDSEAVQISQLCEFILATTRANRAATETHKQGKPVHYSPFLFWLYRQCTRRHSRAACFHANTDNNLTNQHSNHHTIDEPQLPSAKLHVLLSVLLFWRALSWIHVDGMASDIITTNNKEGLKQQQGPSSSVIGVTVRQKAVKVVTMMWNFKVNPETGEPLGHEQHQQHQQQQPNSSPSFHPFRTSVALLMGRNLISTLTDVGRITEMKSVIEFLASPMKSRWLELIEAAERGEEFPGIGGNEKSKDLEGRSCSGDGEAVGLAGRDDSMIWSERGLAASESQKENNKQIEGVCQAGEQQNPIQTQADYSNKQAKKSTEWTNKEEEILHSVLFDILRSKKKEKIDKNVLQKSIIGLSFISDHPVVSSARPLSPPLISNLLRQNPSNVGVPIVLLGLLMIPTSLELQSLILDLPVLFSVTALATEVGERNKIILCFYLFANMWCKISVCI